MSSNAVFVSAGVFAIAWSLVLVPDCLVAADDEGEQQATTQPAEVEPVDYKKLQELMPAKAVGVNRSNMEGENQSLNEWKMSRARADYSKEDSDDKDPQAFVEVMDFGAAPHLVAGMTAWRTVPINIENDDGYQRTGKFKELPMFQTYVKDEARRTMMLLVADRFVVNVEAANVSEEEFKKFAEGLPLEKLARLK